MKLLIVFACVWFFTSALETHTGHNQHVYLHRPQLPSVPIAINGVPIATIEVQNANAAHFTAKAQAVSRNGHYRLESYYQGPAHQQTINPNCILVDTVVHHAKEEQALEPVVGTPIYSGPQHHPVIVSGVPVDTPEVQQAKADHKLHTATANARAASNEDQSESVIDQNINTGDIIPIYSGLVHFPEIVNGVPVDANEVQDPKEVHDRTGVQTISHQMQSESVVVGENSPVYSGPIHHPVIGVNGVPVDTVEVQQAKQAHFVEKAKAHARTGVSHEVHPVPVPVVVVETHHHVQTPVYSGPIHHPIMDVNGVPFDTAEVKQARQAHFVAKSKAYALAGAQPDSDVVSETNHNVYSGPIHNPVIGVNGVPLETVEVQQTKEANFVDKDKAYSRSGLSDSEVVGETTQHVYTGPIHQPVIGINGVPMDTIEVQQAKQAHFVEKARAYIRSGFKTVSQEIQPVAVEQSHHKVPVYSGPLHYAVIVNGVPVDTKEVQKAKEDHLVHTTNANTDVSEESVQQGTQGNQAQHHGHVEVTHNYHAVPIVVNNMQTIYPGAQNYPVFGEKVNTAATAQVRTSVPYPTHPGLVQFPVIPSSVPSHLVHTQFVNGLPVDTPDVQQAKALHFAAKARAYAQHGGYTYNTQVTKQ